MANSYLFRNFTSREIKKHLLLVHGLNFLMLLQSVHYLQLEQIVKID